MQDEIVVPEVARYLEASALLEEKSGCPTMEYVSAAPRSDLLSGISKSAPRKSQTQSILMRQTELVTSLSPSTVGNLEGLRTNIGAG